MKLVHSCNKQLSHAYDLLTHSNVKCWRKLVVHGPPRRRTAYRTDRKNNLKITFGRVS